MAMFEKSVDSLLQKPEAHRKRIVWAFSGVAMVFVVIIWVLSLRQTALKSQAAEIIQQNDEVKNEQRSLGDILDEQAQQEELLQQGAVVKDDNTTEQLPDNGVRVLPESEQQAVTPSAQTTPTPVSTSVPTSPSTQN